MGVLVIAMLLVPAAAVAAMIAIIMVLDANRRLERLERQFVALERRQAGPAAPPSVLPAPTAEAAPPPAGPEVASTDSPPAAAAAETVRASVPSIPAPISVAPAPVERRGFEEQFGTRWVVWVGGVALALGGFFLVRYSIEQGLIGPSMRIFLGALLAAGLIGGGEWTRRHERLTGLAGVPAANIPSILTASGTAVAYATAYAAYGLYDFLSPASAFVILGMVALATLCAALLHGPALAGLGLVGAYVTPLLVASRVPDYWALYIYLVVVTAAALSLARLRFWRWLAATAVLSATAWTLVGLGEHSALLPHLTYVTADFVLVCVLIVSGLFLGPTGEPGQIDTVSSAALAAYLFVAALLIMANGHDTLALFVFTTLVVATVAIAWHTDAAVAALPAAALFAALIMADWAVDISLPTLLAPGGPAAGAVHEPQIAATGTHLSLGALFAILFSAAGFLAQGRSPRALVSILWSAVAVLTPIAILIALYYRIAQFERSLSFAALALLLAALGAVATEALSEREARPGIRASAAIFAAGSVAALALAMSIALEKGWLTVGLALMVPGVAYVSSVRPMVILRWVAASIVLLVLARIVYEPRIVGSDVGTRPIINWLLYGYGGPAISFWVAGRWLRQRADDVPARMVESAAILFTVLLVFLEIRHLMNNGDIYHRSTGLAEIALDVCVALAMATGLEWIRGRSGSVIHNVGAQVMAGLSLVAITFGLLIAENPLLTGEPIGGRFVNLILLGYGLPAILAIVLARVARTTRPPEYYAVAAVTAIVLALAYLSLEVRTLFHGQVLAIGGVSDAEQYTYSATWLGFGVLLLLAGIILQSQPARLASAAVVIVTTAKVFLVDLGGVTGVYRAVSFIGLGLVLVGIGWLYQRLLFPRRTSPVPTPPASS